MILHRSLMKIPKVRKVYFQPPSKEKIIYPCIIYQINTNDLKYSNDDIYLNKLIFAATVIDYDVESKIPDLLLYNRDVYYANFDRYYTADNLNHWVFDLVLHKLEE